MHKEVIEFWFEESNKTNWFKSSDSFNNEIRSKFSDLHQQASKAELYQWRHEPHGRLAEILILDQFSRNLYRSSPLAYTNDSLALVLAQESIHLNLDEKFNASEKAFLYMPYMHSESLIIQQVSLKLFSQAGLENNYDFALAHHDIIERFGRFPHRNLDLNRESTNEELVFLKEKGRGF